MKRLALVFSMVAVLAASAAPAYSAVRPRSGARPALTYESAIGRSYEWANYDWGARAEYTTHCTGPYENAHGRTQWACYGPYDYAESWQVNIDAYGEQTYHAIL
jgi:hypothetical protein